jgi:hypothetical protein
VFLLPLDFASEAVGVGTPDKPEALADVRRSNVGSSQHSPPAVIPERGQITEHSSEPPSKDCWAVLHEDEAGSNLANDARHVAPEAGPVSVNAGAGPGDADVLAWESSRHHVNTASP